MLFDVVSHLNVFSASLSPKMRDFTYAFKVDVFSSVDDYRWSVIGRKAWRRVIYVNFAVNQADAVCWRKRIDSAKCILS